jgi:hypothetical protein
MSALVRQALDQELGDPYRKHRCSPVTSHTGIQRDSDRERIRLSTTFSHQCKSNSESHTAYSGGWIYELMMFIFVVRAQYHGRGPVANTCDFPLWLRTKQ